MQRLKLSRCFDFSHRVSSNNNKFLPDVENSAIFLKCGICSNCAWPTKSCIPNFSCGKY